jgi:hypothetical protein
VLEDANVKLASVATDITGKSGRAIPDALVQDRLTPEQMAELVHRKMEAKKPLLREALAGKVTDHHRFSSAGCSCRSTSSTRRWLPSTPASRR